MMELGMADSLIAKLSESERLVRRARELDPASVFGRSVEGLLLQQAGQTEAAVEHLRRAVDLERMFWLSHHFLSASLIENRRYEEAVYEADVARKLAPLQTHSVAFRGVALAAHGRTAQARAVMDELLQASRERYVPPPTSECSMRRSEKKRERWSNWKRRLLKRMSEWPL
jgi:Flp pilus assembly protein TadD